MELELIVILRREENGGYDLI
ncbi:Protein of unknown function [Bacillus wiedmannii]|uniref:Uncharacterized protein n=1 Tax=Bacillus wiedmannii TaxID=1890302 RepID=A0A1C4FDM0_9BACI|nr:Protein of unknown function [Bacillus wiedmannii]